MRAYLNPLLLWERIEDDCRSSPLLLRLENMHWAGREGTAALHSIALKARSVRVLVLCTYQPSELTSTPECPNPFQETLRLMQRDGLYEEMAVGALDRREIRTALEHYLGGQIDDALFDQIWENSEGNPLVATELARLLVQDRKIENEGGEWIMKENALIEMPDNLQDLADKKIGGLPPEDRWIVEAASVLGDTFDPRIVATALGIDLLMVLERLDAMTREKRLFVERGDLLQFINKQTHLAAYYGIDPLNRRELHRLAAVGMEKKDLGDAGPIALQYYLAGRRESCLCYSLLAGQECTDEGRWDDAVECYERAVEASKDDAPQIRGPVLERLANSLSLSGRPEKAMELYHEGANDAQVTGTEPRPVKKTTGETSGEQGKDGE
jgi:predicted ATPase